jgi:oxalate decarboxylase/phosphoglucose isomerase-like protein (cupin superfamily)
VEWKELIAEDITGSERMCSGIAKLRPGESHGVHNHPEAIEVYHILKGRAKILLGSEEFSARKDTEVFIPKGMNHAVLNTGKRDFIFFWLIRGRTSLSDYE